MITKRYVCSQIRTYAHIHTHMKKKEDTVLSAHSACAAITALTNVVSQITRAKIDAENLVQRLLVLRIAVVFFL